jgi:coenzyme PQQ precursor peptide PqqA
LTADRYIIKEKKMRWKTPKIVEMALGAEINAYTCAEVRK